MDNWMQVLTANGPLILFVISFASQLGAPFPAEILLLESGALVAAGKIGFLDVVALAMLGSVLANTVHYVGGRLTGRRLFKTLAKYFPKTGPWEGKTRQRYERWGPRVLLFSPFLPLSWTIPLLSGTVRSKFPQFLGLSTVGGSIWAGSYATVGFLGRNQIDFLLKIAQQFAFALGIIIGVAVMVVVTVKLIRRRRLARMSAIPVDVPTADPEPRRIGPVNV